MEYIFGVIAILITVLIINLVETGNFNLWAKLVKITQNNIFRKILAIILAIVVPCLVIGVVVGTIYWLVIANWHVMNFFTSNTLGLEHPNASAGWFFVNILLTGINLLVVAAIILVVIIFFRFVGSYFYDKTGCFAIWIINKAKNYKSNQDKINEEIDKILRECS